mmetsp:Transcript_39007/g.59375  ORF Transcript_39007/g.59375 Transcript_39007/m.59375 type:complete len:93 (+) Transcript_39007:517-795(+)
MCEEQTKVDSLDSTLYKLILIPDYSENRSALILKSHHSQGDGLAISSFFHALGDNYDMNSMPAMKPLSFSEKAMIWCLYPVLAAKGAYRMLF